MAKILQFPIPFEVWCAGSGTPDPPPTVERFNRFAHVYENQSHSMDEWNRLWKDFDSHQST